RAFAPGLSPGRDAAEKSGFNMARIISSESFPGCPHQISLPFLTAKAWGMPLTPIGDSHLSLVFFPSTSTAMA
ncbi:hypothetical protein LJB63_25800, partial [[Eubacterium] rectale]|nr:hypothetical protein [Agathobacter rectalis]